MTKVTPNKRYIGLFHYSSYWNTWDKIIGITHYEWIVEDMQGNQRKHCTALEATKFADKPFKVFSNTEI